MFFIEVKKIIVLSKFLQKKTGNLARFPVFFVREAYLLLCVFFLKLLYPAFSVDDLLLASIKRMAFGAYINMYVLSCRSRGDRFTAGADDPYFFVLRMNFAFQFSPPEKNILILIDFA